MAILAVGDDDQNIYRFRGASVEFIRKFQQDYQAEVLPTDVPKVVIEAGTPVGWKDLLGANTEAVGIDHYGASADAKTLFKEFGITADAAVEKAKALIG